MKIPSLVCQALSLIFFQLLFCAVKGINVNAVLNGNAVLFGGQPNDYYPIQNLITDFGYPIEVHLNIRTEDGYLLNMYRIPYGKDGNNETGKPAVLLMHGLLGGAEDWVVTGPEHGLAFLLADAGYDVWLGSARGTTHSRKHESLDPNLSSEYWQFSWHEIGAYDLPAKIQYIQEETEEEQIFYIGHSQGTTAFFVMASTRPEFNDYIKLMVALAPAAYMSHTPSIGLHFISTLHYGISFLSKLIGVNEVHPTNSLLEAAGQRICHERAITSELCANLLFLIGGYDSVQLNRSVLPAITSYAPAGASTRQFIHYAQEINSGQFRQYDHGVLGNLNKYGSTSPPIYDVSRITAPVGIFYSHNDILVSQKDVDRLCNELPNLVERYLVPFEQFNHLDFIYAIDAIDMVYNEVSILMQKYL